MVCSICCIPSPCPMLNGIDSRIPFLAVALDPQRTQIQLQRIRSDIQGVRAATLLRHKPGRRALIRYDLDTVNGPLTLLGKIRAKGTDHTSYTLQNQLWHQGFAADSLDGYSVPAAVGVLPEWRMWLQSWIPGVALTQLLPTAEGVALTRRVATLAHKLHCTPVPTSKHQTLADELCILHERLPRVSQQYPQWQDRITQVLRACDVLVSMQPSPLPVGQAYGPCWVGIHRDFYSDQILFDGQRFWLVDLDLYCQGHPALDIGNFIAHITEQSLRQFGDPAAMADQEVTLRETFIDSCADSAAAATALRYEIDRYTVLTLVRHIHISTCIPARNCHTGAILSLCETRLQQWIDLH